jgi:hypothetical protein
MALSFRVSTRRSDRTGRRLLPPVGSWSPTRVVALPCGHPRGRCSSPRIRPPRPDAASRTPTRSTAPRSMLPRSSRCWTPEVALGSGSCSACRRPCGARCRAEGRSRRRWLGRAWATSPWRHRDGSGRRTRASVPRARRRVRQVAPTSDHATRREGSGPCSPAAGPRSPGRSWDRRVPGARQWCANQLEDATEHAGDRPVHGSVHTTPAPGGGLVTASSTDTPSTRSGCSGSSSASRAATTEGRGTVSPPIEGAPDRSVAGSGSWSATMGQSSRVRLPEDVVGEPPPTPERAAA